MAKMMKHSNCVINLIGRQYETRYIYRAGKGLSSCLGQVDFPASKVCFHSHLPNGPRQVICQLNHNNSNLRLVQSKRNLRAACLKGKLLFKVFSSPAFSVKDYTNIATCTCIKELSDWSEDYKLRDWESCSNNLSFFCHLSFNNDQGWHSGESACLPPTLPRFDSSPVQYVGRICCWFLPYPRVFLQVLPPS